jgi:hypothetical protein
MGDITILLDNFLQPVGHAGDQVPFFGTDTIMLYSLTQEPNKKFSSENNECTVYLEGILEPCATDFKDLSILARKIKPVIY